MFPPKCTTLRGCIRSTGNMQDCLWPGAHSTQPSFCYILSLSLKPLQIIKSSGTLTHRHAVSSEQGIWIKSANSGLRPLSPRPFSLSLSPGWELISPGKARRKNRLAEGQGGEEGIGVKGNAQRSSWAFPWSAHSLLVPVPGGSVSVPCPSPALGSPPGLPRLGPAPAGSSPPPPCHGQQAAEPPVPTPGPLSPHGQPQLSPQPRSAAEPAPATPTWPVAAPALGLQLPACPRKQHGHPAAPAPGQAPGLQLPACPGALLPALPSTRQKHLLCFTRDEIFTQ